MFATATAFALLCGSLGSETLHNIWNPAASLMPFTLLCFLCWSLACGDLRLLPLAVLVFSFVVQAHLGYVVPAVGLMAIGLLGLVAAHRTTGASSLRRWALLALLVGLVCWSAPLAEQAVHRPGNLVLMARGAAADEPRLGATAGWHALVRGVGIPPWWLRGPPAPGARAFEIGGKPDVLAAASGLVILAGLCLVTAIGLRRGRRDVAAAGSAALASCAALALVTASTPRGSLSATLDYTIRWGTPAGMFAWLVLGWAVGTLVRPGWRSSGVRRSLPSLAGTGAVAVVGVAVAGATGPDVHERTYRSVRAFSAVLDARLGASARVLVETSSASGGSFHQFDVQTATVYALRNRGLVVAAPSMSRLFGGRYSGGDRRYDHALRIRPGEGSPGDGKLIARVPPPATPSSTEQAFGIRRQPTVSLTLRRVVP
jgi:hypothetical protein